MGVLEGQRSPWGLPKRRLLPAAYPVSRKVWSFTSTRVVPSATLLHIGSSLTSHKSLRQHVVRGPYHVQQPVALRNFDNKTHAAYDGLPQFGSLNV